MVLLCVGVTNTNGVSPRPSAVLRAVLFLFCFGDDGAFVVQFVRDCCDESCSGGACTGVSHQTCVIKMFRRKLICSVVDVADPCARVTARTYVIKIPLCWFYAFKAVVVVPGTVSAEFQNATRTRNFSLWSTVSLLLKLRRLWACEPCADGMHALASVGAHGPSLLIALWVGSVAVCIIVRKSKNVVRPVPLCLFKERGTR